MQPVRVHNRSWRRRINPISNIVNPGTFPDITIISIFIHHPSDQVESLVTLIMNVVTGTGHGTEKFSPERDDFFSLSTPPSHTGFFPTLSLVYYNNLIIIIIIIIP